MARIHMTIQYPQTPYSPHSSMASLSLYRLWNHLSIHLQSPQYCYLSNPVPIQYLWDLSSSFQFEHRIILSPSTGSAQL